MYKVPLKIQTNPLHLVWILKETTCQKGKKACPPPPKMYIRTSEHSRTHSLNNRGTLRGEGAVVVPKNASKCNQAALHNPTENWNKLQPHSCKPSLKQEEKKKITKKRKRNCQWNGYNTAIDQVEHLSWFTFSSLWGNMIALLVWHGKSTSIVAFLCLGYTDDLKQ